MITPIREKCRRAGDTLRTVDDVAQTVSAIAELIGWLTAPLALLLAATWAIVHGIRGPWREVEAAVTDERELRWIGPDDELRSQWLDDHDHPDDDGLVVYYRAGAPHRAYLTRVDHTERLLAVLTLTLGGVAVAGFVLSFLMPFLVQS